VGTLQHWLAVAVLTACKPRISPLVQFLQISQSIFHQLPSVALPSRRQAFEISANFLPRIGNALSAERAHQLIGIQDAINDLVHHDSE
jgi:hypothetical protein